MRFSRRIVVAVVAILAVLVISALALVLRPAPLTPEAQVDAVAVGARGVRLPVDHVTTDRYLQMTQDRARSLRHLAVDPRTGRVAALVGDDRIITSTLLTSQLDALVAAVPSTTTVRVLSDDADRPHRRNVQSLAWVLLVSGVVLTVLVLRQRAGSGAMSSLVQRVRPGRRDDRVVSAPDVRFTDVAGCDEAVEDLRELVEFLKDPVRFTRLGAEAPRGALLVGPPGTGKTLLARAVAGEAGVPFYSAAGSDFVEMYVGVGARRVRDLFARAGRHEGGAIVFIDEVDAVGRRRGGAAGTGNGEQENTLNALLVAMDGFRRSRVVVIAATNREDVLDTALTRPGRLDRRIHVGLPDRRGRGRILEVHLGGRPVAADIDIDLVARRTPGMSGADLAQVANEASLAAARDGADRIGQQHLDSAIASVTMGRARTSALVTPEDRVLTAWHEAGHAVCGLVQDDAVSPASISIVPRGQAGGVTHFPARDSAYLTRRQAYAQLVTAMGGMAAEQAFLGDGEFTSGPSGDLQQASDLAWAMVSRLGMGERLLVTPDRVLESGGQPSSAAVDQADALLRRALEDARDLLAGNHHVMTAVVEALLEWETLGAAQIDALVRGHRLVHDLAPPPPPRLRPTSEVVVRIPAQRQPVSRPASAAGAVALAALVRAVARMRPIASPAGAHWGHGQTGEPDPGDRHRRHRRGSSGGHRGGGDATVGPLR